MSVKNCKPRLQVTMEMANFDAWQSAVEVSLLVHFHLDGETNHGWCIGARLLLLFARLLAGQSPA